MNLVLGPWEPGLSILYWGMTLVKGPLLLQGTIIRLSPGMADVEYRKGGVLMVISQRQIILGWRDP